MGTRAGAPGGAISNRLTMSFSRLPSRIAIPVQGRLHECVSAKSRLTALRFKQLPLASDGQSGLRNGWVDTNSRMFIEASRTPISGNSLPVEPIERVISVARFHSPL
jgi:hypothetical protein